LFWYVVAIFVAMLILSFVLMPKPQTQKPPGVNELTAPTAEVGREIPVLFGTRDMDAPNVVWYGDIKIKALKKKGGKKG
jgi:hypothetical protein